ncbi:60S ribosomal protein L29 [Coelomomyces lativittatus]|nr:60S ribosomal protein L29 [Coelomomyces lativittatus]
MAKSKNHTNHNQNRKAHRNGIKKVQKKPFRSQKGLDAKFRRNQRFARNGVMKIRRIEKLQKKNQKA